MLLLFGPLLALPRRLTSPPLRPASRASSAEKRWPRPLACEALPPSLAMRRWVSGLMAAKPRRLFVPTRLAGRVAGLAAVISARLAAVTDDAEYWEETTMGKRT